MFFLSKPDRPSILDFIAAQKDTPFSYPHVGCTREERPRGYTVDHNRALLGHGLDAYEKARSAIRQWKMLDMPWLELCWPEAPIEIGTAVAVAVSHFGFWSLNACRIAYVEDANAERYGFAYGTLMQHEEIGEERFTVEFHASDASVWYDLYAISRPGIAACSAYPLARMLQRRFARDSLESMRRFMERL